MLLTSVYSSKLAWQLFYLTATCQEEALIVAGYPELYNISSSDYHNLFLKKRAWREISLSMNIIVVIASHL